MIAQRRTREALRTVATLAVLAVTLAAASSAFAADYRYWVSGPQTKVLPTSPVPATAGFASQSATGSIMLSAAQAEFEGVQVPIRPLDGDVYDVWLEPSDLVLSTETTPATIPKAEASVYKVGYVRISSPSYGYRTRGLMPDPLIPMVLANGQRLGWMPGGQAPNPVWRRVPMATTQPFYVLFHVPVGTPPGVYTGHVAITAVDSAGAPLPEVRVPVQLTVQPFSIAKRTLKTAFGINLKWAMYANSPTHTWLTRDASPTLESGRVAERTTFRGDQMAGWHKYFSDHRISPQTLAPAWETGSDWAAPTDNYSMVARPGYLADYLGTGPATTLSGDRYGFNAVKMPEYEMPAYARNPFSSRAATARAIRYFRTMRAQLAPWLSRTYLYAIDEPRASQRPFIERYARFVHRYVPGVKFLVTTDPVTMGWKPLRGVDIYVEKLHFFYRDYSRWVRPLRRSGRQVWIYTHATTFQAQTPNYLIDGPLVSPRAQGWFAYHTSAPGLLYFSVSAWRPHNGIARYRDPYADPLSYRSHNSAGRWVYANGDGSLVYPGYYPARGLVVAGAPPVGSLRMESLRDGLEDYEYLRLYEAKFGKTAARQQVASVIGRPKTVISSGRPTFPSYPKGEASYVAVRARLAAKLAATQ